MSLVCLPREVLHFHIFPYLQPADLLILSHVSINLRLLVSKQPLPSKGIIYQSAFRHGSVSSLSWLFTTLQYPKFEKGHATKGLVVAAEVGNLPLLIYAKENSSKDYFEHNLRELIAAAAAHSQIPILEWLLTCNATPSTFNSLVFSKASECGKIDVLCWAKSKNLPLIFVNQNASLCASAALGGHFETVRWLHENGLPWDGITSTNAASNGHRELLEWVVSRGCPERKGERACAAAAERGDISYLQWLIDRGYSWGVSVCSSAAKCGHLETLKYARAHGCPWDVSASAAAAERGHLAILEWIHTNGGQFTEVPSKVAAAAGHLEVLKWLQSKGYPINSLICAHAAAYGRLEILQWAKANGFEFTHSTYWNASNERIRTWLKENGAPTK